MRKAPTPKDKRDGASTRTGGTFLRASDLQALIPRNADALIVGIDLRPTTKENASGSILGPDVGRFGVDVPVTIAGVPYIVTLPDFTDDYRNLVAKWGEDLDKWAGRGLALWTHKVSEKTPSGDTDKHYLRFRPSEEVILEPTVQKDLRIRTE